MKQGQLICVVGPTASGKTKLALALARHFNTEIISADSRQCYREVRIGTARPTDEEMALVPHHLIGHKSVNESYSAGDFAREARTLLDTLFTRLPVVILVGGSGMYIKALIEGLDPLPPADETLRKELHDGYTLNGLPYLHERLLATGTTPLNPEGMQNPQRLMRAIEIALGSTDSSASFAAPAFATLVAGLDLPRETLYARINKRVEEMMAEGLLEEVRSMLPFRDMYAMQTVGYAELFDYLEGRTDLQTAVALIKQHTRNYAKRQMTWFRKMNGIHWFHEPDPQPIIRWIQAQLQS